MARRLTSFRVEHANQNAICESTLDTVQFQPAKIDVLFKVDLSGADLLCSDGNVAFALCDGDTCPDDPELGCEEIGGQKYCCEFRCFVCATVQATRMRRPPRRVLVKSQHSAATGIRRSRSAKGAPVRWTARWAARTLVEPNIAVRSAVRDAH